MPNRDSIASDQYYFSDPAKKSSWRDKETPHPPKPFNFKPNSVLPSQIRWKPTSTGSFPLPGPWAEVFRIPDQPTPSVFNPYDHQYRPHRQTLERDRQLREYHFANPKNFANSLLQRVDPQPPKMSNRQATRQSGAFVRWTNNAAARAVNAKTRKYEYLAYRHLGRGQGRTGVRNFKAAVFRNMTPLRKVVRRKAQQIRNKKAAATKIQKSPAFNAGVRRWYQGKVREGAGNFIASKLGAAYRSRKARAQGINPFAVPYVSDAALTAAAERAEAAHARALGQNPFAVPYVSDEDLMRAADAVEAARATGKAAKAAQKAADWEKYNAEQAAARSARVKTKLAAKTALMRAAKASRELDDFALMAAMVDDPNVSKGSFAPGFNPPSRKRQFDYSMDVDDGPVTNYRRVEEDPPMYQENDDPQEEFYFPSQPADDTFAVGNLTPFDAYDPDIDPPVMDVDGSGLYRIRRRYRKSKYQRRFW